MSEQEKDYKLLIIFNGGVIFKSETLDEKQKEKMSNRILEDLKDVNNGCPILIYTDDEGDDVYIQKSIAMNSLFIITPNWRRLIEDDIDVTPEDIKEGEKEC